MHHKQNWARAKANYGGRYSIWVNDVRGTVAPSPVIYSVTLAQWGHVSIQVDANSFISNNDIFNIQFLNTYYHNLIDKIFLDLWIQYTPIHNVRELRTYKPK